MMEYNTNSTNNKWISFGSTAPVVPSNFDSPRLILDITEITKDDALDRALAYLNMAQRMLWLAGAPDHPEFKPND